MSKIKLIVSQRVQECVQIEEEIKQRSDFIQSCVEDLEEIEKQEMTVIDARIAALIQEREEANERNMQYKNEVRNLGESWLSPLKERKERLERLNMLQRSLTAPVTKLPVELLRDIFNFYVDMDEAPWLLVLVCPTWRRIAFSIPKLWRYVLVTNNTTLTTQQEWDIGGDLGKITSSGQYTRCATEAELVQVLALSGTALLHVSLNLYGRAGDEDQGVGNDLLCQLLGPPTSSRIGDIKIELGGFREPQPLPLSFYMETPYPRLRSLTFSKNGSGWDTNFIINLLSSTELRTITFHSSIPSEITTSSDWASVRHLTLPSGRLAPSVLNEICTKVQNIQTLKHIPQNWPNESTPGITFKFLTKLELQCDPSQLHHINLPSLVKLKLSSLMEWADSTTVVHPSWNLPALLKFCGTFSSSGVAKYLPSIKMPKLETLSLVIHSYAATFPSVTYSTVRSVELGGSVSSSYLLGALSAVPNALKVIFSPTRSHRLYVQAILTRLIYTADLIPPMVSEMHFGTQKTPLTSKRPYPSLCRRYVAERKAASDQSFKIMVITSSRRSSDSLVETFS
ncbi:hypothetical protein FRC20_010434 [Serendipita sp. 405]|nr:hypothetical protein FRC20_010434 [Serendipita sp. 405]